MNNEIILEMQYNPPLEQPTHVTQNSKTEILINLFMINPYQNIFALFVTR